MKTTLPSAVLILGLTLPGSAIADEYACRSLEGESPVTLDFALRSASDAYSVTSAAFQIEGDIGYSTVASEPTALATVTGVEATSEDVRFSLHYTDANYDGDVATVHVVTLADGAQILTAGVLRVVGGGLWPVRCEIDYEG